MQVRKGAMTWLPLALMATGGSVPMLAAAPAAAPALPTPPANGEMGFIVHHFGLTHNGDDRKAEDCPDGMAGMLRENLLATLPATERERLQRSENGREFQRRIEDYVSGPEGTDICTHPAAFDRPAQKMVQGRVIEGFNLDADRSGNAPGMCKHDNFASPSGDTGIDNQAWRAIGCLERFRDTGGRALPDFAEQFDTSLTTGENGQLILLKGVDSLVRDDHVEIIYANTPDKAIRDSRGHFVRNASYAIGDMLANTPRRNILQGRIANGILEAQAPRFIVKQATTGGNSSRGLDLRGPRGTFDLQRVRLRISFQPDGSLKGLVGGYQPFGDLIKGHSAAGRFTATNAFWDCTAIHAALRRSADGDPDPITGQCTTISSNYEFFAVPAFVIDPDRGRKQISSAR